MKKEIILKRGLKRIIFLSMFGWWVD